MADAPAPARRLTAEEREQWWLQNRHRTDELLHSPDPEPRTGGVENATVQSGQYFRDENHKRPPVGRGPVIDLRKPDPKKPKRKPARPKQPKASRNGRPKKRAAATPPQSSASKPVAAAPALPEGGIEVRDGIVMVDGVRFGPWLRLKRAERGMSQPDVAKVVGCSHARPGQLETEYGGPAQRITPIVRKIVQLFRGDASTDAAAAAPKRPNTKPKPRPRPRPTMRVRDGLSAEGLLARAVAARRADMEISRADIHEVTGVPMKAITLMESGKGGLLGDIDLVAAALGCSVADLFREE